VNQIDCEIEPGLLAAEVPRAGGVRLWLNCGTVCLHGFFCAIEAI